MLILGNRYSWYKGHIENMKPIYWTLLYYSTNVILLRVDVYKEMGLVREGYHGVKDVYDTDGKLCFTLGEQNKDVDKA